MNVWIATGDTLNAIDPESGEMVRALDVRALDVPAHAGTAFDSIGRRRARGGELLRPIRWRGRILPRSPGGYMRLRLQACCIRLHRADDRAGK